MAVVSREYQQKIADSAIKKGNTLVVIPTGLGKCHAYNDFIITETGAMQTIGSLVESSLASSKFTRLQDGYFVAENPTNLKVLSWTEQGIVPNRIIGFTKRMAKELVKVRLASGIEITVTPEHPLLTLDNALGWVSAHKLRINSQVAIPKKISIKTQQQKMNFLNIFTDTTGRYAQVKMKDGTSIALTKFRKLRINPKFVEGVYYTGGRAVPHILKPIDSVSKELARFIGLITAEGVVGGGIRFYNDDPTLLEDFKQLAMNLFEIKSRPIEGGLILRSTSLYYFLRFAFGIVPSHSKDKIVPKAILESHNGVIGAYLSGLYDGEGSVGSGVIEFVTASLDIANKLPYLLRRFGIVCRVKRKISQATNSPNPKKRTYYRIHIEGKEDMTKFLKNINFKHPKRAARLTDVLNSIKYTNTNVDTFNIGKILKRLRTSLGLVTSYRKDFPLSDFGLYERAQRNPSRQSLENLIQIFQNKYLEFQGLNHKINHLQKMKEVFENIYKILRAIPENEMPHILSESSVSRKQLRNWTAGKWEPKIKPGSPVVRLLRVLGYDVDPRAIHDDITTICKSLRLSWFKLSKAKMFMVYVNHRKLAKLIAVILKQWKRIERSEQDIKTVSILLHSGLQFDKVIDIKHVRRPQWVYDLCTETGNFIVGDFGGLISHNTFIGALVMEHFVKKKKRCMFLAPTRPLVTQHVKRLNEYFADLGYDIVAVTGQVVPSDRMHLYQNSDIVVATPQTVRNDLKKDDIMSHFSCLVVDECHRAIGQYAYTQVAEAAHENKTLVLGLTASPGGRMDKIREIMDTLSISNVEIRTEDEADVSKYVQPMKVRWIETDLSKEIGEAVAMLSELMEEKVKTLQAFGMKVTTKTSRSRLTYTYRALIERKNFPALGHFAIFYSAFHGAELLETEGPYAFIKFVERLKERKKRIDWRITQAANKVGSLEHPKMGLLLKLLKERKGKRIIVFAQYRDQVRHIVDVVNKEGFKSKQFLGRKGSTAKAQKETLEEFGRGDFDILVASSIGEEGIDVPAADSAIFYEPVPSEIRSIQRRGRVGRAKEGEVLVLVTKGTRDETFRYVSAAREKKMKSIIKKMSNGEIKKKPRKKPKKKELEQSDINSFFD